jgi:alkylation response protein AidB-like acyl-CoA dehydrogenase
MISSGRTLTMAGSLSRDECAGSWPWAIAAAFADAVRSGRLNLPLPGRGRTRERWAVLADLGEEDLCLARLAEGHTDAIAILAELGGGRPPAGRRWGVWAAQPPGPGLIATRTGHGWRLDGTKQYCSGARSCTDALVTAAAPDGSQLFAVNTRDLSPVPGSWPATGMAASDTLDVEFTNISAQPVGEPGSYTGRPGFTHGGAGVAACWYGGARGVARRLLAAAAERDPGPHALAHLGAVHIALHTARTALDAAAAEIDADPADQENGGRLRALRVRALVEATATEVMHRVGRALGAGPLSHDEAHSRRVADLTVYLRQHHAERDLAELGALVADRGPSW